MLVQFHHPAAALATTLPISLSANLNVCQRYPASYQPDLFALHYVFPRISPTFPALRPSTLSTIQHIPRLSRGISRLLPYARLPLFHHQAPMTRIEATGYSPARSKTQVPRPVVWVVAGIPWSCSAYLSPGVCLCEAICAARRASRSRWRYTHGCLVLSPLMKAR